MTWKPRRVFVPFQWQYKEQRKQPKIMDSKTYQDGALKTMANQRTILDRLVALGPKAMQLDNGARGLADDAGEVNGVIKKYIEYGQPLDVEHLKEELGDCFWRMLQICKAVGITFEDCWAANDRKLNKVRYKDGYSDDSAKEENRDREAERQAMTVGSMVVDGQRVPMLINDKGYAEPVSLEDKQKLCRHNTIDRNSNGQLVCLVCRKVLSMEEEPQFQNGHGWTEPEIEVHENLPPVVRVSMEGGTAKIVSPTGLPTVVRKVPNHSYTRYCSICNINLIHKTNTSGICTDCFMKTPKPKETTNDPRTTG